MRGSFLLFALVAALPAPGISTAGSVFLPGLGASVSVPVTSLKERKFLTTRRQQYDFSCGAAALATLLSYHYERPTDEATVFKAMFEVGDREKIEREGFSMLDMKKYLASIGLRADGFRINLDKLAQVGVPAIALVTEAGYRHFVVVKGIRPGLVLVGDPYKGTKVFTRGEYEGISDGILFVIRNERETAQRHFNQDREWGVTRPGAPSYQLVERAGAAAFTLRLPAPSDL